MYPQCMSPAGLYILILHHVVRVKQYSSKAWKISALKVPTHLLSFDDSICGLRITLTANYMTLREWTADKLYIQSKIFTSGAYGCRRLYLSNRIYRPPNGIHILVFVEHIRFHGICYNSALSCWQHVEIISYCYQLLLCAAHFDMTNKHSASTGCSSLSPSDVTVTCIPNCHFNH